MRLSTKEHWEEKYELHSARKSNQNSWLKRILGRRGKDYFRSYDDYLLWDVLYPKFMPKTKNSKVLEVRNAPGGYLVRLSKTFGFVPYGVEYSESGAELNRRKFIVNKLNPDNVICADFFSKEFHEQYAGFFDIVVSRGFIEHFSDSEDVIARHLNLVRNGGYLFITVPNYRGINYFLQWMFKREILPLHRLDIMQRKKYCNLFVQKNIIPLHCDYWGTFNFGLFYPSENPVSAFAYRLCAYLQLPLNLAFRILFRDRELKCSFSSPHLIFIGQKKEIH
jgi:SAM-dependent methyltransferase